MNLHRGVGEVMLGGVFLTGIAWGVIGLAPPGTWLAALVLGAGLLAYTGGTLFFINYLSLRQAVTPDHLLGRVISTMIFLTILMAPLGSLLGGAGRMDRPAPHAMDHRGRRVSLGLLPAAESRRSPALLDAPSLAGSAQAPRANPNWRAHSCPPRAAEHTVRAYASRAAARAILRNALATLALRLLRFFVVMRQSPVVCPRAGRSATARPC
jgi:hypothetical protein